MRIRNDSGLLVDEDSGSLLGHIFIFNEHGAYSPDGKADGVTKEQADVHNRLLDEGLLKGLDENCQVGQGGTFYYYPPKGVQTWTGTIVATPDRCLRRGQVLTFRRNGRVFRGRLQKDADCFNFKRVA